MLALRIILYNSCMCVQNPFNHCQRYLARTLFIVLTLASGWLPGLWILQTGYQLREDMAGLFGWLILLMSFGPGLAALLAKALEDGPILATLGLKMSRPSFMLLAWFLFPSLAGVAAGLSVIFGLAEWDWNLSTVHYQLMQRLPYFSPTLLNVFSLPGIWLWLAFLLFGPVFWLLPALFEEMGWRGYVYSWCPAKAGWLAAGLAGGLWWLWKLPLFLLGFYYPGHPYLGLWMGLGWGLGISVLLTGLRKNSHSLVPPAIAQATLSSSAFIPLAITESYDLLWAHFQGMVGVACLAAFIFLAWRLQLFSSDTSDT